MHKAIKATDRYPKKIQSSAMYGESLNWLRIQHIVKLRDLGIVSAGIPFAALVAPKLPDHDEAIRNLGGFYERRTECYWVPLHKLETATSLVFGQAQGGAKI